MSEWQPIETAPKDQCVLVSDGRYVTMASNWTTGVGRWVDDNGLLDAQPTHWMPLPDPPKGQAGAETR